MTPRWAPSPARVRVDIMRLSHLLQFARVWGFNRWLRAHHTRDSYIVPTSPHRVERERLQKRRLLQEHLTAFVAESGMLSVRWCFLCEGIALSEGCWWEMPVDREDQICQKALELLSDLCSKGEVQNENCLDFIYYFRDLARPRYSDSGRRRSCSQSRNG